MRIAMAKALMKKNGKYRSTLLAAVHETAQGLRNARVMAKETMRKFDLICLTSRGPIADHRAKRKTNRNAGC
jgi:putative transcriptional regulator